MAKASWRDLVEKDSDTAWKNAGKPKFDPAELERQQREARRTKVMSSLDQVIASLEKGEEVALRGWHSVKADMAKVTVKLGNKVVELGNRAWHSVPAERAKDFYAAVRNDVEAGNLDKELEAADGGAGTTRKASTGARGGGWSEERKADYRAKMAGIYEQRRKAKAG